MDPRSVVSIIIIVTGVRSVCNIVRDSTWPSIAATLPRHVWIGSTTHVVRIIRAFFTNENLPLEGPRAPPNAMRRGRVFVTCAVKLGRSCPIYGGPSISTKNWILSAANVNEERSNSNRRKYLAGGGGAGVRGTTRPDENYSSCPTAQSR